MMHLFYTPEIHTGSLISLSVEETQHAVKVLRMRESDTILVTDGQGTKAKGRIISLSKRECMVQIDSAEMQPLMPALLTLAVAPPKNIKRFEWLLEKATEIGVHRIAPFVSRYSERKDLKTERLQKLVLSAMKQSLKYHLPRIEPLQSFDDILQYPFEGSKLIAWCKATDAQWMDTQLQPHINALVMVGPEGGFSQAEYDKAVQHGFKALRLSNSRLRTETAALSVCQQMAFINKY